MSVTEFTSHFRKFKSSLEYFRVKLKSCLKSLCNSFKLNMCLNSLTILRYCLVPPIPFQLLYMKNMNVNFTVTDVPIIL